MTLSLSQLEALRDTMKVEIDTDVAAYRLSHPSAADYPLICRRIHRAKCGIAEAKGAAITNAKKQWKVPSAEKIAKILAEATATLEIPTQVNPELTNAEGNKVDNSPTPEVAENKGFPDEKVTKTPALSAPETVKENLTAEPGARKHVSNEEEKRGIVETGIPASNENQQVNQSPEKPDNSVVAKDAPVAMPLPKHPKPETLYNRVKRMKREGWWLGHVIDDIKPVTQAERAEISRIYLGRGT